METATDRADLRTKLRPSRGVLVELAAQAYYDAAMSGAPMSGAVSLLETYRVKALESADVFVIWDELDALAVDAVGTSLEAVVGGVRRRYADELARGARAVVQAGFDESPERGWHELLHTHGSFCAELRTPVCLALVDQDLPVPEAAAADLERLRTWTRRMHKSQWRESEAGFTWLADNADVTPRERARLLIAAAQTQLYHYQRSELARHWLERASAIDPDLPEVHCAWGEYWLVERELERAMGSYETALEHDDTYADAHCGIGDVHAENGRTEEAERCYLKAAELARGETTAYDNLLALYGRPELFAEREPGFARLAACRIASSPEQEYTTCVNLGGLYRRNSRYREAESWYRRAVELDGAQALAFTEIGQLHLDQDDESRAQEAMERSIELEPDLFDGYWAMGTLHEQFERYGEAARWYLESLSRYPQWEPAIIVRVTDLQTRGGRHDDAEATLFEHLERHPDDDDLRGAVATLALAIAGDLGDRPRAVALYDRLLRLRGPGFEADRDELVGDLLLELGDVDGALDAYGDAVAARPGEAGFHRKVATAASRAGRWDQAHAELRSALELDQDEATYRRESALTFNDAGNEKIEQSAAAEAVALYKQAIEMDPEDAVLRGNLAIGYEALAQTAPLVESLEMAVQAMRDAVRLDPDNVGYTARLERLVRSAAGAGRYGVQLLTSPVVEPIVVEVSDVLVPKVNPEEDGAVFVGEHIPAMRGRIEADRGVVLRGVQMRANPVLGFGRYRVLLWEVLEAEGEVIPDHLFALGSPASVEAAGVSREAMSESTDPLTALSGAWVPATEGERLRTAGIEAMADTDFLIRHLEAVLRARLDLLFGLDAAEPMVPPSESGPRRAGWARVLRALARDGLPLRATELDTALLEADLSPEGVPDAIRKARLALAALLPGNTSDAHATPVPGWAEEALEAAQGSPPRLTPMEEQRLVAELGAHALMPGPRVVVTRGAKHRPYLQRLLADGLGTRVTVVDAAERAAAVRASAEVT